MKNLELSYKMNEVIKILPMTTLLSDMLELSRLGWCIVGFKNDMVVLKFKEVEND